MQQTQNIKELTGIRFFAAFHVLLFHNYYISGELAQATPSFIRRFFSFGDGAVAFFFILSGFILSYVYINEKSELKTSKTQFALARFSRLYPVYVLALVLDLPRGVNYFFSENSFEIAITKISVSLAAYLSMLQSWYPRVTASWNSPAWSLSVEAFFYLVFPFLIKYLFQLKSSFKMILVLYCIPVILFLFLESFSIDFKDPFVATFWRSFPVLRLTEFIIGILLGKVLRENGSFIVYLKENHTFSSLLFWGCLCLSLLMVSLDLDIARELRMNLFLIPCFSMMILLLGTTQIRFTGFLRSKLLTTLGNASFTLYIIHQPILYYMELLSIDRGPVYFLSYCILTTVLSVVIYKKFEVPLQKLLRRKNPFN